MNGRGRGGGKLFLLRYHFPSSRWSAISEERNEQWNIVDVLDVRPDFFHSSRQFSSIGQVESNGGALLCALGYMTLRTRQVDIPAAAPSTFNSAVHLPY